MTAPVTPSRFCNMKAILPDSVRIEIRELGPTDQLYNRGEEHGRLLDLMIRHAEDGSVIAIDLRGLEYIGYSYAKRAIREVLLRRNDGEYGDRRLFLVADQSMEQLEGLEKALEEKKLFMLLCERPDSLEGGHLIGEAPQYLQETFDVLRKTAPVTTGSLAKLIDQSPQNTKNRLDRLESMGLVRREKEPSPTGGLEWVNRVF